MYPRLEAIQEQNLKFAMSALGQQQPVSLPPGERLEMAEAV
jgi:hypothetical protein